MIEAYTLAGIFTIGLFIGFVISFLLFYYYRKNIFAEKNLLEKNNLELSCSLVKEQTLRSQIEQNLQSRISELSDIKKNMKDVFEAISKESLLNNSLMLNQSFKQSLQEFFTHNEKERTQSTKDIFNIIFPLKESLVLVEQKISELEKIRSSAYGSLTQQLNNLLSTQNALIKETNLLKTSLSAPSVRGKWGEMQLKRVLELSGLSQFCDFIEQETILAEESSIRPDVILTLPHEKKVIIDAKAPLDSFLDTQKKDFLIDDTQQSLDLAVCIKRHISTLKKKNYTKYVSQTPEFVILFLPGDMFLYKALSADNSLIEFAAKNDVILATPLTLIAILKAVSYSFNEYAMTQNIEEAKKFAQELIDRIAKVAEHFERLGKSLKVANDSYNQTLSSLKSRVLVTAQKLSTIKSFNSHQINLDLQPLDENISVGDA